MSVRGEFPPQEADGDFFFVRQEMDMDPSASSHSTNFFFTDFRDFRRFAFHSVNVFVCFCFVVRFHVFFFSGEKIEAKEKVRSTIQQSQKPKEEKISSATIRKSLQSQMSCVIGTVCGVRGSIVGQPIRDGNK